MLWASSAPLVRWLGSSCAETPCRAQEKARPRRAESGAQQPWYADPAVPLTSPSRRKIASARINASRDGRVEVHGKVVAELSFGFWWSLLGHEYNRRLWQPCLRSAFDGSVRRAQLHSELNELRLLRNRIAHHEPIHGRDLDQLYVRLLGVAERISPLLRSRIEVTSRVPSVLGCRPPDG